MTAYQGWEIGGGGSEFNGIWQPHWGIDLATYATSGRVAILVRDDYNLVFRCTTNSSGTYSVKVYTSVGNTITSGIASNTDYTFNVSSYSNPFADPNSQNGYGTYVLEIEATTSLASISCGTVNGSALWLYNNATIPVVFSDSGKLEIVQMVNGGSIGTSSLARNYSLKRLDMGTATVSSAASTYSNSRSLMAVDSFTKTLTGYTSTFAICNAFCNCNLVLDGTYPNATTMANFIDGCSSISSLDITAPALVNFTNNRDCLSLMSLRIRQSNFRGGSGTVLSINRCAMLDPTVLAADIGAWELSQGGAGCLTGKTFVFTGCLNAATFDATPITNLGATVTR